MWWYPATTTLPVDSLLAMEVVQTYLQLRQLQQLVQARPQMKAGPGARRLHQLLLLERAKTLLRRPTQLQLQRQLHQRRPMERVVSLVHRPLQMRVLLEPKRPARRHQIHSSTSTTRTELPRPLS